MMVLLSAVATPDLKKKIGLHLRVHMPGGQWEGFRRSAAGARPGRGVWELSAAIGNPCLLMLAIARSSSRDHQQKVHNPFLAA